jgi:hypothetical protein
MGLASVSQIWILHEETSQITEIKLDNFLVLESATAADHRDLMNELTTISAISCHENIVNLIGACTSEDGR